MTEKQQKSIMNEHEVKEAVLNQNRYYICKE